jgi:Uma2 family endonuclease
MTMAARAAGDWTIADLEALPDDGNRYEISDGSLLVTPPPTFPHLDVQKKLTRLLEMHAPAHLEVWCHGVGVKRGDSAYYIPDVVVFDPASPGGSTSPLEAPAVRLVVEVVSPDYRSRDFVLKRRGYAVAGVPEYWIVDHQARTVSVLTLDDAADEYREWALVRAGRPFVVTRPFAVKLDPAEFC